MTFRLVPISAEELFALGEPHIDADLFDARGLRNPYGVLTRETIPHSRRIDDVRANPDNIRWYYRLVVEDDLIVGSVSFHGPPDGEGMVEIGLGVAEPERGKGYATAAVTHMWDWAADCDDVRVLRYTVSPGNAPSQAIIAKFPATHRGIQIDDEDGPEDIYEIEARIWQEFRRGGRFDHEPRSAKSADQ